MMLHLFELSIFIMHGQKGGEILGITSLSDSEEKYMNDVLEVTMSSERMFMVIIEVQ